MNNGKVRARFDLVKRIFSFRLDYFIIKRNLNIEEMEK